MSTFKIILKTSHKQVDRVENCLSTWLKGLDYICLTDRILEGYNSFSGSISDNYESNEEKTVNFINFIIKTPNWYEKYDWLVFIDDDAILNVKMFNSIIGELDKSCVYGLPMSSPRMPGLTYPSGGSGYFISPSKIIGANRMNKLGFGFEDMAIGNWLKENNIPLLSSPKKLNGWFPFPGEWDKVSKYGDFYIDKLIKECSEDKKQFIKEHLICFK